jgi:hypothetical protein
MDERLRRRSAAVGEVMFMQCRCGPEAQFLPVVLLDANKAPLIVAIVCGTCGNEAGVQDGRVQV